MNSPPAPRTLSRLRILITAPPVTAPWGSGQVYFMNILVELQAVRGRNNNNNNLQDSHVVQFCNICVPITVPGHYHSRHVSQIASHSCLWDAKDLLLRLFAQLPSLIFVSNVAPIPNYFLLRNTILRSLK